MKTITMKSTPSRLIASSLVGLLAMTSSAHALSISQSELAPSENVIASSGSTTPHASSNTQFNHSANIDRFGGVAFSLAQASLLDAVTVYVHSYTYSVEKNTIPATTAAFSVSIVAFNTSLTEPELPATSVTFTEPSESWTTPPAPPTLYSTVYSETIIMPSSLSADQFLTFTFSNSISLDAGTTYGIVFHWLDDTAANAINIRATSTASEARDFRTTWARSGGVVSQYDTAVMGSNLRENVFILQGSAIPEPAASTVLLSVVVLAGVLSGRRRHSA